MGKTIIFSGGIENLVNPAKQKGCGDGEAEQASQQCRPNQMEAEPPDQNRREDKKIEKKPVCEDSDVNNLLAKRFPSFSDGFGVESFAGHFFQNSFTFWRS